jgi:predicted nuclease of predicted toxin-antitoxin system
MKMKFKLDENLGKSIQNIFLEHGHDCQSVLNEELSGIDDQELIKIAHQERRIMITLDHGFGNILVYPPDSYSGIAILNPPGKISFELLKMLVMDLLAALEKMSVQGRLWIVEPGRIREHDTE